MKLAPASKRSSAPGIPLALLLLLAACGDGDRPRTPTEPPFVHPGPNPVWEAISEEAAGAVVGTLTWALDHAEAIESLGDWNPATGSWRVATTLPLGQPADLAVQFRNREGAVRKHYVGGTTAEIRVTARVLGASSATDIDVTLDDLGADRSDALASWSGSVRSGDAVIPCSGSASRIWDCGGPLRCLFGGMLIRFEPGGGVGLSFLGGFAEGIYVFLGGTNHFSIFLQPTADQE